MLDYEKIASDYGKSYQDKTRVYFIEKFLSTFNASEGKQTAFHVFPRQKAFLESLANNKSTIAIKHRQAGITTVTSAWVAAEMMFATPESPINILCIGNKLDLANQIVTKIRDFLLQIPRYYWGEEYFCENPTTKEERDRNTKDIFIKSNKSELMLMNGSAIYARSSGPNAARGISAVKILIFDEAAFIEDGLAVYSSAVAATASVPDSKIVMISTPNGKDELYYNTYKQALEKRNSYNAVEFKWFQDPRYSKFLKWYRNNEDTGEVEWIEEETIDAKGSIKYDEERWRTLEKEGWKPTSPWYIAMCKDFNNDSIKIAQELDVSFMGSANNVVDPSIIEMHQTVNVMEPLSEMKDAFEENTWFWKPPIEGHRYILSCIPEGETVLTSDGEKRVEDITDNDKLITIDGKETKIKRIFKRLVKEEKMIKIRVCNDVDYKHFTYNHPIYASINTKIKRKHGESRMWDYKWDFVNAEDVNIGDWVQMPNIYTDELNEEEILKQWDKYKNKLRADFSIENPIMEEDFWWYCGIWLAEGWCYKVKGKYWNSYTSHNINEIEYINKIKSISKRLFKRKLTIIHKKDENSVICCFCNSEIGGFIHDNFGKYAKNKHIPEWIKRLPKNLKIQLISGYLAGDGYIHRDNKYSGFTSISKKLLCDIQDIMYSLGLIGNLKLHVKEGFYKTDFRGGTTCYCQNKYELTYGKYDTKKLMEMLSLDNDIQIKNRRIIKDIVYDNDNKKIYRKISNKEEYFYSGYVYNFEVEDDTHTFCCRNIVTHNCDPSRGTSEDNTAIEVIDMDGKDENGMPIIEQVCEFVGKKLGDEISELVYRYARLYNDAYVVFDATGGQADSAILPLMGRGYKNIYYEDNNQKTYMMHTTKYKTETNENKLPGFHFQGNRFVCLNNFANMVRNNEFKIRSQRVINELDTWIFKGDNARMDHMSGSHDDTITSLAMGLFVLMFSYKAAEIEKNTAKAILKAYIRSGSVTTSKRAPQSQMSIGPKSMPIYNSNQLGKTSKGGGYMWLFTKIR